ncbi:YbaB/EbfC family nucleoid-associated protein [Actinokineospora inagensis]|uniref:YbaB/EbfC family nucleoid-associated protein n=1 Tax=Actinokineospora inagensis TaxID=103730 RepID=UPI0003F642DD|nr:YbaB/EbfC family nucleoid-associated protein [Actinokineospora inagensis]
MSTPLHNELAAAVAELREQQEKINAAVAKVAAATTTLATEDHMVEATVDGQGKLTGLKFHGRRWRDLAPAELATRLVELIGKAQDQSARTTATLFAEIMPAGAGVPDLATLSDPDALTAEIDAMINAVVREETSR